MSSPRAPSPRESSPSEPSPHEPSLHEPSARETPAHPGEAHPERVALQGAREETIERLSEAFARDIITLEAFEQRVDRAFACRAVGEFDALLADLGPVPAPHARVRVATEPLARAATLAARPSELAPRAPERVALSVLGNVERRGRFSLPRFGRALSVLGNLELDLRDVAFPLGVTELRVSTVLGNVEIIVPPHLAVETQGSGILGSFASIARRPLDARDEPVLRIVGIATLGNVEIRTLPRALPERV